MTEPNASCSHLVSLSHEELAERLAAAAKALAPEDLDGRELEHLVRVLTRCSALLTDVYTDSRLRSILEEDPSHLTRLVALPWLAPLDDEELPPTLARIRRLPGEAREVGDQALFDVAVTGLGQVRGVPLDALGPRAYRLAADVLEHLAADARLREHFELLRTQRGGPDLDAEVGFLRRCSDRFSLYARMIRNAGESSGDDLDDTRGLILAPGAAAHRALVPATPRELAPIEVEKEGEEPLAESLLGGPRGQNARLLGAYERLLLFSSLDLSAMRSALSGKVVDQSEAVETLIDDFALFAVGTQQLGKPASYFLVGPTGVGKNYLVETLRDAMELQWDIEVPLLMIEGPNYTYPSDINELRGATRGFIRSDEPGLLTEFHEKLSESPLGIILVDEVEKAHPQLRKFFLSILDRGTLTDAKGNELDFSGALIFFTSNIGYVEGQEPGKSIGFGGREHAERNYRAGLSQALRKTLSPEFINRVKLVRFQHLPRDSARTILELEFQKIASRYKALHGVSVELSVAGREALLDEGYSEEYGARHLASVLNRTCNVAIGKMIREDEGERAPRDPGALLAMLRDLKKGEKPVEMDQLERMVREEARARVPYSRIVVDAEEGGIVYRREER